MRIVTWAALAGLAMMAGQALGAEVKRDIQGVALGMTLDEARTAAGLRCEWSGHPEIYDCTNGTNRFLLRNTESLEDTRVASIVFPFCSADSMEKVIYDFSSAFGSRLLKRTYWKNIKHT